MEVDADIPAVAPHEVVAAMHQKGSAVVRACLLGSSGPSVVQEYWERAIQRQPGIGLSSEGHRPVWPRLFISNFRQASTSNGFYLPGPSLFSLGSRRVPFLTLPRHHR